MIVASDAVNIELIAFFGIVVTIVSPSLAAYLMAKFTARNAMVVKQLDWAREDELAARIARIDDKTDKIHALVDSAYTASLKATSVALAGQLRAMERVAGDSPDERDAVAMNQIRDQIRALESNIADRLLAEHLVQVQSEVAQAAKVSEAPPPIIVEAPVQIPVPPPENPAS